MKFSTLFTTRDCFRYFSLVSTNWTLAWFVASPITLLPCSFQSSILAPCSFVSIPWFSSCFIPILGSCTIVLSKSIYLERSLISVGKIWNWSLFIVWASWLSDSQFFITTFPSINSHCRLQWIWVRSGTHFFTYLYEYEDSFSFGPFCLFWNLLRSVTPSGCSGSSNHNCEEHCLSVSFKPIRPFRNLSRPMVLLGYFGSYRSNCPLGQAFF